MKARYSENFIGIKSECNVIFREYTAFSVIVGRPVMS